MRRVAMSRSAGAYLEAVGIRCRREWCRHIISRKELVGITGRLAHADEQEEVLAVGEEVWEEWIGQELSGGNRVEEEGEGRMGSKGEGSRTRAMAQECG